MIIWKYVFLSSWTEGTRGLREDQRPPVAGTPSAFDYYHHKSSAAFDTLLVLFIVNLQDYSKKLRVYLVSQKFQDCTETFQIYLIMNQ